MGRIFGASLASILALSSLTPIKAAVSEQQRSSIDKIFGTRGIYISEEGVYRLTFARDDIKVSVNHVRLLPGLGMSGWAAFAAGIHHEGMLAGQFVLLEDEVNPVLTVVLDAGLEVTALGSSLLFEIPRLVTLDVGGTGSLLTLASAYRKGMDEIRRVRAGGAGPAKGTAPRLPEISAIDPGPLNSILSMRGAVVNGIYKAAIGRKGLLAGEPVGREMGMSTWIAFAGMNTLAVTEGEFIATADELQALLKALRSRHINITSIRNHTIGEHPRFVFVRFWGEGPAVDLAKALRYALDVQVGAGPSGAERI